MQQKLIIILALALTACTSSIRHKKDQAQPVAVQVQVVGTQTAALMSHYVGTVEAVQSVPLSLQTAGRVEELCCRNGDRVSRGQVLLRVDATQATNALRSAQAALRQAQDGYDRVKRVHDQGAVTDQQMVEIESRLAQAQALCDAAQRQVNECALTAPFDGVVSGLDTKEGQTVVPGIRLMNLLDITAYSVRFTVPESEISHLAIGQKGQVDCPAADRVLDCRVADKGLEANRLAHTYEVKADIQGGQDVLRPGMVCKVRMQNRTASATTSAIVIPAHCVHLLQQGPSVWIVRNGQAARVQIQTGGYQADGIIVKDGLQCGDTLVVDGYQKLYKDCKVICNW